MGFTGSKALNWKLKYITAFNEMEKTLAGIQPSWSDEMKGIFKLDQRTTETNARLDNFENTMPLFNTDCKDLQALVRKIATKVLGGYRTPAYKDNSLRGKVYADIQGQLRRQFGVERYESIKRIQIDTARTIVSNYILPMFLQDDITLLNNQLEIPFAYEN
ncbi:ORF6C domain-containing protein (plasmid) [Clostridium estertheticum]|nr:ORF6C domain-containing protein [Clostridium estertheticum]WLC86709.1 ORF6C domain-containing protein [Clostridium estertheticum]